MKHLTRWQRRYRDLFHCQTDRFDELAIALELRADEGGKLLRSAGNGFDALLAQTLEHIRLPEACHHLGVQPLDDVRRRAARRDDAVPAAHLIARQAAFGKSRDFG